MAVVFLHDRRDFIAGGHLVCHDAPSEKKGMDQSQTQVKTICLHLIISGPETADWKALIQVKDVQKRLIFVFWLCNFKRFIH